MSAPNIASPPVTIANGLRSAHGSRPLAPRGGNDRVYTPARLAKDIVQHFKPFGACLEPCEGKGAFTSALKESNAEWVFTCEIDNGVDFMALQNVRVDWIVTNPPWSQFRAFLAKSMEISDNVVFLALLNAWFMRARVADMRKAGFGLVEVLMLDTPPKPWPQTGFQLAAVHAKRGHTGATTFSYANVQTHTTEGGAI